MDIKNYKQELAAELRQLLAYWMDHSIDKKLGGFYGSIDQNNSINAEASKGAVQNARILWTFSAAYNFTGDKKYLPVAERAYAYLIDHFTDKVYGGVYWSVDALGNPLNQRKQIYGLAFYLYGLSEYYQGVKEPLVLQQAVALFKLMEEKSFDAIHKGYFEAFARDWQPLLDLRLSDKDANEKKTMNTHLHVIEAYATLYKQWPDDLLRNRIVQLLQVFDEHMIDKKTGHLVLFFDEYWKEKPDVISYGHDIEAAWLLQQCAEIIKDEQWIDKMKHYAITVTRAAMQGLDADGGLWYEYDTAGNHLVKEKHWWPQAEAMVGFFNAWEITADANYLHASLNSWQFIKKWIRDDVHGEWFWGVNEDHTVMKENDKLGFWKCPYHNSRACMEIIKRITALESSATAQSLVPV
ncbi:MAG: AGE family epimerase/isomerase [Chitinophagaceae bacterium]